MPLEPREGTPHEPSFGQQTETFLIFNSPRDFDLKVTMFLDPRGQLRIGILVVAPDLIQPRELFSAQELQN